MRATSRNRDAGQKRRAYAGPALFSHGFRPFFFFAALFAGLAIPVWMAAFAHGYSLGAGGDAMAWHAHEMIFGYTGAVISGFLLTAIPNWTGRAPVMGVPLAALFGLWVMGRIAMLLPESGLVGRLIETLFLLAILAAALREVVAGKNWRNLPVVALLASLVLANGLWHAQAMGAPLDGLGQRLALSTITLLMLLIGGRVIPSFTTNWMKKERLDPLPTAFNAFDRLVLATSLPALAMWIAAPWSAAAGAALALAAVLNLFRLARWRGWQTLREPLVTVLHIAYLWIAVAFGLLAASILTPGLFPGASALHALTAGAVGLLTVAVMTRATRGHSGRPLLADTATVIVYALIFLGALMRLILPFTPLSYAAGASLAGVTWSAGMLLFTVQYGPMLLLPRPDNTGPRS